MRHEARDSVTGNDGVGINADEKFGILNMLDSIVESIRLAGVRLGENDDSSGSFFAGEGNARDFEGAVARAVVDHNHAQVGIIRVQRGAYRARNYFFFVVGGDKHRNFWFIRSDLGGPSENLLLQPVVDCSRT